MSCISPTFDVEIAASVSASFVPVPVRCTLVAYGQKLVFITHEKYNATVDLPACLPTYIHIEHVASLPYIAIQVFYFFCIAT